MRNSERNQFPTGGARPTSGKRGGMAEPSRPSRPRIPPLTTEERSPAATELLQSVRFGGSEANIFTTLVRAPGLTRRWLPFGGRLLAGKLPADHRELLILRTAWNCQAEYEWAQHVPIAKAAGISAETVARIPDGPGAGWEGFELTLLQAADELHHDWCIGEQTWEQLAREYDEEQLIEVPMLVGHYHMVAMTLNSLGIELDDGLSGFPR